MVMLKVSSYLIDSVNYYNIRERPIPIIEGRRVRL